MYNILANKFMDFLTDTIAETKIPIWVALVAATLLIIIVAVIILVCVSKKSKKNIQQNSTAEPIVQSASNNDSVEDEIVFDSVEEPFIAPDIDDEPIIEEPSIVEPIKTTIAAEPQVVEPIKPIIIEEPQAVEPAKEVMATVDDTAESAPIIPKAVETAEEKVTLPERGIDTKETKMIAKPMTKATETEPKEEPVKPVAKPIAKPAPKPIATPIAKPIAKEPAATPTTKSVAKPAANLTAKPAAPTAKPVVKAEPIKKAEPVKKTDTVKETEIRVLDEEKETFGKYVIRNTSSNPDRPFTFELVANNGQLLFESEPFKQKPRQASIDAFKKHVKEGVFVVDEDKQGTFRYKLYSNKNLLIGVGETYKSKASCESSIESVKRFSESATIVEDKTV